MRCTITNIPKTEMYKSPKQFNVWPVEYEHLVLRLERVNRDHQCSISSTVEIEVEAGQPGMN
jgi:hypothetical protein